LTPLIDDVVGGDMVSEPKPSPEGLDFAIQNSNIRKESTVYVGDSKSDGLTSDAAGIKFIGVLTGTTSRKKLCEFNPIDVIEDLDDLLCAMDNLNRKNEIELGR